MKIIEDLIAKMMNLQKDFWIRKFDLRSIWMFYKCYNLSINILGVIEEDSRFKNLIWKKLIQSAIEKDERKIIKYRELMHQIMTKDISIISKTYDLLIEENKKSGVDKSKLWRKGIIGFSYGEITPYLG